MPNWEERPLEEEKRMVEEIVQREEWIMDGLRDMAVANVDTIVWLDFSFAKVMYRVIKRSMTRALTGMPLYHNNKETLRLALSKDSMIIYAMKTYKTKKQTYEIAINEDKFQNINWIRIRNQRDEKEFWKKLSPSQKDGQRN